MPFLCSNNLISATPCHFNGYPEIIGEGNVTSMVSPDGSTQLVFLPTTQWWRSYSPNPNTGDLRNPYLNNLGAWFVRSIYNPIQPTVLNPPYQTPYGLQYPRASSSDCCLNGPAPSFSLKFHNDNCTSTSDIQYFIPKQFNLFQSPKGCTFVQEPVPLVTNPICHNEVPLYTPFNKQCKCVRKEKEKIECACKNSYTSNSEMSIEEAKSDLNLRKNKECRCKLKKKKGKKNKCECKKLTASNKSVTTYADQSSGCVLEKGQQTQAPCRNSCKDYVGVMETRKATRSKSHSTIGLLCENGCCSGSCSCNSDTESEN